MSKLNKKNDVINEYKTEADVESKFVYGIFLRDILEIPSKLINLHVPVKITQGRISGTCLKAESFYTIVYRLFIISIFITN